MEKIFPLNLTAKAAAMVTGNPVTTRMEGGVGNCFPGLEFDHRNLDRRFFPGLVIEFGDFTGARLVRVDTSDPDLDSLTFEGLPADAPPPAVQSALQAALNGAHGAALGQGAWVLDSITQGKRTISVADQPGIVAWRLVHSLEPGAVSFVLRRTTGTSRRITLNGWRRRFVSTKTGVISEASRLRRHFRQSAPPAIHRLSSDHAPAHAPASSRPLAATRRAGRNRGQPPRARIRARA